MLEEHYIEVGVSVVGIEDSVGDTVPVVVDLLEDTYGVDRHLDLA